MYAIITFIHWTVLLNHYLPNLQWQWMFWDAISLPLKVYFLFLKMTFSFCAVYIPLPCQILISLLIIIFLQSLSLVIFFLFCFDGSRGNFSLKILTTLTAGPWFALWKQFASTVTASPWFALWKQLASRGFKHLTTTFRLSRFSFALHDVTTCPRRRHIRFWGTSCESSF